MIHDELGIRLVEHHEEDPALTEEQKRKMTKSIFTNEAILKQLREAAANPDYIESDEEALRIIYEARDAR